MIGKILGDRYEIIEKVGIGGMAVVYKAKCRLLNRYVGIKVLRPEFTEDEDLVRKFKRESQAAASLSHPNIVNVYDVGQWEDTFYIVMEYIEGVTLKDYIEERGSLGERQALNIGKQIAKGLKHAHLNGIIHRDIKPHNILIKKEEDGRIMAKVTDFGIALATTSSTLTNTGSIVGSVHYFSPEQGRGGYVDEKSDLYSLGIVMYQMVTGRVPFNAKTPIAIALKHSQQQPVPPRDYNENISEELEAIILKLLEKEQSMRYQNAESLIQDLVSMEEEGKDLQGLHARMNPHDASTQVMGKNEEKPYHTKVKKARREEGKKKEGPSKASIIAIVLAVIIIIGGGFGLGYAYVRGLLGGVEEVEVPEVIGMELEEAIETLETNNLLYEISEIYHPEVPENIVVSQRPGTGRMVLAESTVELQVSIGPEMVLVPNLVREKLMDAELILREAGLILGEVTYEESDFPEGVILSQSPDFREEVRNGSAIDIVVSEGMPTLMPDLSGLTRIEAERIIRSIGLIPGEITEENHEEVPMGRVISQSIPGESEVEADEIVDFVLSLGPEEEEVVPEEITKEIEISLAEFEGVVVVEVFEVISATNQRRIHREEYDTEDVSIVRIPFTAEEGSGEKIFDVEIDGAFYDEVKLEF